MSRTTKTKKPSDPSSGQKEQYSKNNSTFTADMRFIFTRNKQCNTSWVDEDEFDETAILEHRFYPPIYN